MTTSGCKNYGIFSISHFVILSLCYFAFALCMLFVFSSFPSFSQSQINNGKHSVSLKIVYLSREAIRNTFRDENGTEHPIFQSKEEAIAHIRDSYKEISKAADPKIKSKSKIFYVWRDENEYQDGEKTEEIFFDLKEGKQVISNP